MVCSLLKGRRVGRKGERKGEKEFKFCYFKPVTLSLDGFAAFQLDSLNFLLLSFENVLTARCFVIHNRWKDVRDSIVLCRALYCSDIFYPFTYSETNCNPTASEGKDSVLMSPVLSRKCVFLHTSLVCVVEINYALLFYHFISFG